MRVQKLTEVLKRPADTVPFNPALWPDVEGRIGKLPKTYKDCVNDFGAVSIDDFGLYSLIDIPTEWKGPKPGSSLGKTPGKIAHLIRLVSNLQRPAGRTPFDHNDFPLIRIAFR
jgi:hypothetical protein